MHRDVKPQNCIVSVVDKKVKLIDLGAAADLRVGINYSPSEYLMDPRWVARVLGGGHMVCVCGGSWTHSVWRGWGGRTYRGGGG